MNKAPLIVVEGIDGSGKDTQADMLVSRLIEAGLDPLRVAEPCEELPHGRLLRELLRSGEYQASHAPLFLADRMALQEAIVAPALALGRPVVSVRSFLSTLVYQQENWPLGWLIDIHRQMLTKPNVVVYLDINPQEGLDRVGKRGSDKEVYERIDILERNRQRYLRLVDPDNTMRAENWPTLAGTAPDHDPLGGLVADGCLRLVINASGSRDETHDAIWAAVKGKVS